MSFKSFNSGWKPVWAVDEKKEERTLPEFRKVHPYFIENSTENSESNNDSESLEYEDYGDCNELCDSVKLQIKEITNSIKEQFGDMIQRKGKSNNNSSGSAGKVNGLEYLGIKHLADENSEASLFIIRWAGTCEAAGIPNKFDAVVAVKVERKTSGQRYWWTLTDNNPNLDTLCDSLGKEESAWKDAELRIFCVIEQPSEMKHVRSKVISKGKPETKKRETSA